MIKAIADGKVKITPEVMVSGGGSGGGVTDGLLAMVMGQMTGVVTKPRSDAE